MFDEERFDDLTRALATGRLSRGQVLKSFAAGVLLAGPLGSLFQKAGVAQTVGCVASKCVKSAKSAYESCNRSCRKLANRTACLEECQGSYGGQLLNCGCVTANTDTATGMSTYAPCENPCTPQTLYDQANQDMLYLKLADHLINDGFVANGKPTTIVFKEDGTLVRSMLSSTYSNTTRTSERAVLYYDVEATGETISFATVLNTQEETLLYLLEAHETGQVERIDPSTTQQQTSMLSSVSSSAAGQTCDSNKLRNCLTAAALTLATCLAKDCTLPCLAGGPSNPACQICMAKCAGVSAAGALSCSQFFGCGVGNLSFCSNNVCCGLTETGCGTTCCASEQPCCGGTSCCGSPLTCCSDQCVDTTSDLNNCSGCGIKCPDGAVICDHGICRCSIVVQPLPGEGGEPELPLDKNPCGTQPDWVCCDTRSELGPYRCCAGTESSSQGQCEDVRTDERCGDCSTNCKAQGLLCCAHPEYPGIQGASTCYDPQQALVCCKGTIDASGRTGDPWAIKDRPVVWTCPAECGCDVAKTRTTGIASCGGSCGTTA